MSISGQHVESVEHTRNLQHKDAWYKGKGMAEGRLEGFYREISADLDRTMSFWMKYSHDTEFGGFFNCIGPSGDIYDTIKYVWLQGRQVWMYARLYNEEDAYKNQDVLNSAIAGKNIKRGEFLLKYATNPTNHRCYLILTRDGKPIKIQRSIFSECFYTMAMSELARATHQSKYKEEVILMMDKMVHWVREDWTDVRLGLPPLEGETRSNSLALPMMLLCLVDQVEKMDEKLAKDRYEAIAEWSVDQILAHIQRDGTCILENVSLTGDEMPGCFGRLMIPGHSIEAGWFLLQYGLKRNKTDLINIAIDKFMVNPFQYGWDPNHGGLFYFLDVDGHSPVQLEWNMKLWWTHSEALIAFLMAFKVTKNPKLLEKFATIFDYCYSKHVDKEGGEWFGYLNRDGTVSMKFKGGPWKGCFHVPRALLMCKQMLNEILHA